MSVLNPENSGIFVAGQNPWHLVPHGQTAQKLIWGGWLSCLESTARQTGPISYKPAKRTASPLEDVLRMISTRLHAKEAKPGMRSATIKFLKDHAGQNILQCCRGTGCPTNLQRLDMRTRMADSEPPAFMSDVHSVCSLLVLGPLTCRKTTPKGL